MAVVSDQFVSELRTTVADTFHGFFPTAENQRAARTLAMDIPASTETVTHNHLGTVPQMEITTQRLPTTYGLYDYRYSLTDDDYSTEFGVHRRAIEDDALGFIPRSAQTLASRAAQHDTERIFQLSVSGESATNFGNAYTGSPFFSNSHTIGDATVDNLLAGADSDFLIALGAARKQMRLFEDDRGEPMNLVGNVIEIGPGRESEVWAALNDMGMRAAGIEGTDRQAGPPIPATQSDMYQVGSYTIVVNPYRTSDGEFVLYHSDGAMTMPYIVQTRMSPDVYGPSSSNNPDGSQILEFKYGVRKRKAYGYGDPRFAVLSKE